MLEKQLGIEDSLQYLIKSIAELKTDVTDIKAKAELRTFTLKEIAAGFGYNVQTFRNKPWNIPNFGKPDVDLHPARWYSNTIERWYAIPESERRYNWETMTSKHRLKAIGKTV